MTDRTLEADVAVIGGGPAGTVAARRLATLGYNVVVAHEPCRHDRIETLPPSLSVLGHDVLASDRLASIAEPVRSIVSGWSGEEATTRDSPGSSMVGRRRFDQLLLLEAARAGVVVLAPARARAPHRGNGRWIVPATRGDKTFQIVAQFVLDARGRRARNRLNFRHGYDHLLGDHSFAALAAMGVGIAGVVGVGVDDQFSEGARRIAA